MPVEIKELIIRAVVVSSEKKLPTTGPSQVTDTDKEAIVAACVRQVLQILKRSRER
jgi:hypothetical protein